MPVKLGCASDYNKNHPERIQKKRDEETIAANCQQEIMDGSTVTNTLQNWLRVMPHTKNGKIVEGLLAIGKNSQVNIQQK